MAEKNCVNLDDISSGRSVNNDVANYETLLKAFGYSVEDLEILIKPMAMEGKEPVSSMGNDTTLAALSDKPQRLFNYFRQQFAQVTNPPIDPIREELVMSLTGYIGAIHQNLLEEIPALSSIVKIKSPILTNTQFDILLNLRYKGFSTAVIPMLFDPTRGAEGLKEAVDNLCRNVEKRWTTGKLYYSQ